MEKSIKGFLITDSGHVLLLKKSSNSMTNSGKFELPGGKFDKKDRNFFSCLIREITEEMGDSIIACINADYTFYPKKRFFLNKRQEQFEQFFCIISLDGEIEILKNIISLSDEHSEFIFANIDIIKKMKVDNLLANNVIFLLKEIGYFK